MVPVCPELLGSHPVSRGPGRTEPGAPPARLAKFARERSLGPRPPGWAGPARRLFPAAPRLAPGASSPRPLRRSFAPCCILFHFSSSCHPSSPGFAFWPLEVTGISGPLSLPVSCSLSPCVLPLLESGVLEFRGKNYPESERSGSLLVFFQPQVFSEVSPPPHPPRPLSALSSPRYLHSCIALLFRARSLFC